MKSTTATVSRLIAYAGRLLDTLSGRVLLALLLCGAVPITVTLLSNKFFVTRELVRSEREKHEAILNEIGRQIASVMEAAYRDLKSLQSNPVLTDPDATGEELGTEIGRLVDIYNLFEDISVLDEAGIPLASTSESRRDDVDTSDWLKRALKGQTSVSSPEMGFEGKGLFITVYHPVEVRETGVRRVVRATQPFTPVHDRLNSATIAPDGEIILIDRFRNLLYHSDAARALTKFDPAFDFDLAAENPAGRYTDPDGGAFFYSSVLLDEEQTRVDMPWLLVSLVPESQVMAAASPSAPYQVVAALFTLATALGIGAALAERIAKPIMETAKAAEDVGRGTGVSRVPERGSVELRTLAVAFNKMAEEVAGNRQKLENLVDQRTAKLRASERELRRTSAELRAAFEAIREAVLVVGSDGVVISANRRTREYFGFGVEVAGVRFDEIKESFFASFGDSAETIREVWKSGADRPLFTGEGEWQVVHPTPRVLRGYTVPVRSTDGEVFARLWTFEDITRERELQKGLEQAQKMEAIGRLAGGIAHDFNNLLTGIIGNLSLADLAWPHGAAEAGAGVESSAHKHVQTAKTAAERAAGLVKQMLGFSRRSHLTLEYCDINAIVREVHALLQHTFDPRIEIESRLRDDLWGVEVDPTQVQQVIMNLCVNARDAINGDGRVTLSATNVSVSDAEAAAHESAPGDYVLLEVTDTGAGIAASIRDKIFEPFFTTKEPGRGTGLGLATSYGIVQQHGGWIDCDSVVGQGTTFKIYLPRKDAVGVEGEDGSGEAGGARAGVAAGGGASDNELLLLVDDEAMVRAVAEGALRHHGYQTMTAADGVEAIELVEARGDEIALVLLDLTMPKLSGKDTFRVIKKKFPDLPVVICSGYLLNLDEFAEETGHRPTGFVQKPYNVGKLAEVVRAAIDGDLESVLRASGDMAAAGV